jgi:hypothetical protein
MIKGVSKEEVVGKVFYGQVVDINDPVQEGRCRVRVFGIFDDIADGDIPWASPGSSKTFGGGADGGFGDISIPKNNAIVRVSFAEGNLYSPEWYGLPYLNGEVRNEIADSYLNSHVILYDVDEQLKVFYTPAKGFEIHLRNSHITINPDTSITIEHSDSQSIVELVGPTINIVANSSVNITANSLIKEEASEVALNGTAVTKLGPAPTYSAVLAEPLWTFLKSLAAAVDGKLPSTPGVFAGQAAASEQLSTSKNVKISP